MWFKNSTKIITVVFIYLHVPCLHFRFYLVWCERNFQSQEQVCDSNSPNISWYEVNVSLHNDKYNFNISVAVLRSSLNEKLRRKRRSDTTEGNRQWFINHLFGVVTETQQSTSAITWSQFNFLNSKCVVLNNQAKDNVLNWKYFVECNNFSGFFHNLCVFAQKKQDSNWFFLTAFKNRSTLMFTFTFLDYECDSGSLHLIYFFVFTKKKKNKFVIDERQKFYPKIF